MNRTVSVIASVLLLGACGNQPDSTVAVACGALEHAQGMSMNGMSPQGLSMNGLTAQGLAMNGITAQGLAMNGITAQGVDIDDPTELGAFALRGVTEEQANAWLSGAGSEVSDDQLLFLSLESGILRAVNRTGAALSEAELTGVLLPFHATTGELLWFRITNVAPHPDVTDLRLYTLAYHGQNVCGGDVAGLFVPGVWDETGARVDALAEGDRAIDTTFSCTTGVIAKCTVWGYRPWTVGATLHQACTRLARADYCGDGVPHTENGTLIDVFDPQGIQQELADDGMTFEAAWGPEGAVCVREPRYVDRRASGEVIYPSCWADKPRCETWADASGLGAVLGNNSLHTLRQEAACR